MQRPQLDYAKKEDKKEIIRRMYSSPVKHYVREAGWLKAARNRKDLLKGKKRELRYFTLCSLEAIDIKTLYKYGILNRDQLGYPSTYFCEWDSELIEEIARVVGSNYWFGSFEDFITELYNNNDRYRDKLKEQNLFPFDIYNLDFTGSCIPGDQPPYSKTLEALTNLVDLQHKEEHNFDIFLTFSATENKDNKDAIAQLAELLDINCKKYSEAKKVFDNNYLNVSTLKSKQYEIFIAIAIPKFLASKAKDFRYKLEISPSYKYKRVNSNGDPYYITSMILSLEYIRDKRDRGLIKLSDPPISDQIDEKYYPQSIIEIFNHDIIDVDKMLSSKPGLRKKFSEKVKGIKSIA